MSAPRTFLLAGLTGGIATGKSTVSAMFTHLGARVTDADQLARDVVAPGQPAHAAVVAEFGREVLQPDGYLDRKRLGARGLRGRREAQAAGGHHPSRHPHALGSHPLRLRRGGVRGHRVLGRGAALRDGGRAIDGQAWWWSSPMPEVQLARLMARDGSTEAEARARIASQMPVADKAQLADYVIDNSGPRAETERQVREVYRALLADLAARRAGATR